MLTGREVYEIWAPSRSIWSPWVAPALFASLNCSDLNPPAPSEPPNPAQLPSNEGMAVILDIPGPAAVRWGLELAHKGWRPVPVINTTPGPASGGTSAEAIAANPDVVIDLQPLVRELCAATEVIKSLPLPDNAPPAFLLDSARLRGHHPASPGMFDNRWMVFPQDLPSARKLMEQGILSALLLQFSAVKPQEDLTHALLRWQNQGIEILSQDLSNPSEPQRLRIMPPSRFGSIFYRALAIAGFRRNSSGGFGSFIPETHSAG